ncbi:RodZ family helix-turn-helix domain-containing protein [uncultured Senegalimassilia sp.]|uniref:helix-turn-helix domain-containing protein n=1 Tax=uncultured Senegalimassilia sp. TaxID=1714350 RepID=UPI0025D2D11A|nr:helix-turn-helix transcriptional regulator [uncultured Senegalimassilia sp.]
MGQVSFGTVLREARERKGYDVQSAARRLRIRPDILRALENNDFSRLPARGYTRNMVNAYAKLVGLNPADITRMYLDDAYAYQVGRTRGESDSPAHVSGRRSVSRGDGRHDGRGQGSQRSSRYADERTDSRRSQRAQRGQRQGTQRMPRREQQPQREYRESLASRAARAENESRRSNHFGGAVTTQFTNFYSGSQNNIGRGMQARLPYVAVIVIILLLLVIIVALAFGNRGAASTQEVAKVPITGVTDTSADGSGVSQDNSNNNSGNNNDSDTKSSSEATVPTSVKVEYKLAKGQQAYVVITQDGQATEQMLTGPVDETVEVTGTWSLSTWVSSGFTVTMDGKEVEFTSDATTGMPTATVNFKDYLASWAKDHPDVKVDGLDSSSTSSGSTGSTSSSSNSTSSGISSQSATGTGSSVGSSTTSTGTGSTSTGGTGSGTTGTQNSSSTYSSY